MIQIFLGQNEGKSLAAYNVAREAIARKKTVCVMVLFKGKHYPGKLKKLVSRGAHVYMFMPRFPKLDNDESLSLAQKKGAKVIEHIKRLISAIKRGYRLYPNRLEPIARTTFNSRQCH